MSFYDVIVVGGGPAGLVAAGRAAELGAKVLVLEKMKSPGKKLLITGKGRCNITNGAEIPDFIQHVFPNGKFLRSAFSQFFSKDIIQLLESYGVSCELQRGQRYFPKSEKAADVLNALLAWCKKHNVRMQFNAKVDELIVKEDAIEGVLVNGKKLLANHVIIATGGKSYPATGSTGDGYAMAIKVGHRIEKPLPSLVPVETKGTIAQSLDGLNLRNVSAKVWIDGKGAKEDFGELSFTKFGLSGPIILTLSRVMVMALELNQKVELSIDLKPALDIPKLDKRLIRDLNEAGKKSLYEVMKGWLPALLIPVFIKELAIDSNKLCNQVGGKERKQIRNLMKSFHFEVTKVRSFKEAIITAGGVSTKEIVSKTMESKKVKGLFFAGELIDVDAETGGFNLQIAYSTGWTAGNAWKKA